MSKLGQQAGLVQWLPPCTHGSVSSWLVPSLIAFGVTPGPLQSHQGGWVNLWYWGADGHMVALTLAKTSGVRDGLQWLQVKGWEDMPEPGGELGEPCPNEGGGRGDPWDFCSGCPFHSSLCSCGEARASGATRGTYFGSALLMQCTSSSHT